MTMTARSLPLTGMSFPNTCLCFRMWASIFFLTVSRGARSRRGPQPIGKSFRMVAAFGFNIEERKALIGPSFPTGITKYVPGIRRLSGNPKNIRHRRTTNHVGKVLRIAFLGH